MHADLSDYSTTATNDVLVELPEDRNGDCVVFCHQVVVHLLQHRGSTLHVVLRATDLYKVRAPPLLWEDDLDVVASLTQLPDFLATTANDDRMEAVLHTNFFCALILLNAQKGRTRVSNN